MVLNVVLVEPEIAQNAGNVARTCAAVGARLHLVKPLGFILSDRRLRRAGADYWTDVDLLVHDGWAAFQRAMGPAARPFFFSTRGGQRYDEADFEGEVYLIFGRESTGLSGEVLAEFADRCYRIPLKAGARSLNLSNAVAVVVFEALRRKEFPGLR